MGILQEQHDSLRISACALTGSHWRVSCHYHKGIDTVMRPSWGQGSFFLLYVYVCARMYVHWCSLVGVNSLMVVLRIELSSPLIPAEPSPRALLSLRPLSMLTRTVLPKKRK